MAGLVALRGPVSWPLYVSETDSGTSVLPKPDLYFHLFQNVPLISHFDERCLDLSAGQPCLVLLEWGKMLGLSPKAKYGVVPVGNQIN